MDNSLSRIWHEACRHLRGVLNPDAYSRWIEVITPESFTDHTLTLAVDNQFYQTWLEENYVSLIRQAVEAACGEEVQVALTVRPGVLPVGVAAQPAGDTRAPSPSPASSKRGAAASPLVLNPKFTFDAFVVGPSNTFAHAASLAVAQAPARAYNPLFIYGQTGLGKTHLMQAIGHHVLLHARASVTYLSSEAMLNEYIESLRSRSIAQFRKKYRHTDLLLIDDIHFLGGKDALQEEFFHTFNTLFDAHKQIVMTSDRPAAEIPGLEQRLVSRFEWGLVTELEPPDLETRIAILQNKQAQAGTRLPDDILLYIAQNIRSNIRRLEGALIRCLSYAALTGRPLSVEAVRYLLRDTIETEKEEEVTFSAIQKAVAEHYDVRIADMTSKRRPQAVAMPRQVAMYLCRRLTRSSLPEIAVAFGKTHATVLHAYKTIHGRLDVDPKLRRDVDILMQRLKHSSADDPVDKHR